MRPGVVIINDVINDRPETGELSFWQVLEKSLPNAILIGTIEAPGDILGYLNDARPRSIISNSILGSLRTEFKTNRIVFLQDDYAKMHHLSRIGIGYNLRRAIKFLLNRSSSYATRLYVQKSAMAKADVVVCVSASIANSYKFLGHSQVIIHNGVDTDVFKPMSKVDARNKLGVPKDVFVKIFVGSTHWVKGFDIISAEIDRDRESMWLVVLKKGKEAPGLEHLANVKVFKNSSHKQLAELYNASDLFVGRSRVESFWLAPIEAMFCGVPVDVTPVGIFSDWKPANKDPRREAFEKGLDRATMIKRWKELVASLSDS